jgi:hypothetical protein
MSENIKVNKDGTISPIDPTKPSSFTTSTNQSSMSNILTLEEIIADYIMPAHMHNGIDKRAELKASLIDYIEGLVPEKLTIEMNKYHHQTQIDGYNQAVDDMRAKLKDIGKSNG